LTALFRKLFNPATRKADEEIPTVPTPIIAAEERLPAAPERTRADLPQFVVGYAQSLGKQRDHNEDALFTLTTNLGSDQTYIPLGLYIVADGMGGHKHGEIASSLAVRVISGQVIRKVFTSLLSPKPQPPDESLQEIMQESVQEAHRAIIRTAPGAGTTATAILILEKQMTLAHVGDSRGYAITLEGEMQILTRDHSLVMRMMELGQLTAAEAAVHPQRNVLYRALGQGEIFSPDTSTFPLPDSGYILLCSDGLWGVVPESEISHIIASTPDPQQACQMLVDAANEAGGPDNITAILVRLPS
jgi:serine/threonine protein phosphatase PrpC